MHMNEYRAYNRHSVIVGINQDLEYFIDMWNNHPMRSLAGGKSPNQIHALKSHLSAHRELDDDMGNPETYGNYDSEVEMDEDVEENTNLSCTDSTKYCRSLSSVRWNNFAAHLH